jgi:hypothetical protein
VSNNNNISPEAQTVYLEAQTTKETIVLKISGSSNNPDVTAKELAKSLIGHRLGDDVYIISASFISKQQYDSREADWVQTEPIDFDTSGLGELDTPGNELDTPGLGGGDTP